jgi:hypothetical protein
VVGDTALHVEWNDTGRWLFQRSEAARVLAPLASSVGRERNEISENIEIAYLNHRTNPHLSFITFRRPNSVASDEPYTYLGMYRAADLTVTDRVHAAAATLAAGGQAVIRTETPRARLLDRVADATATDAGRLYRISHDELDHMKDEQVSFLAATLS